MCVSLHQLETRVLGKHLASFVAAQMEANSYH